MPKLPFIIIFDIDKTIIGTVRHCATEHGILELVHKICKQKGITNACPSTAIDIQDELKQGLLRPGVKEFINFCNKRFKNVEICIYTNSSYK